MTWIPLATRLGLHIALGYMLSLLVLGPAPVGRFFYRMVGWTAALAAGLAGLLALVGGWPEDGAERLRVAATLGVILPAPWYVSNKPQVRRRGLVLGVASGSVALAAHAFGHSGLGVHQFLTDLSGAAVAGGVCFAMVFGHGYLTVPKLPVQHLVRINRFAAGALGARLLISGAALGLALAGTREPSSALASLSAFDYLDLGVRYGVGLGVPLLLAAMVHSSLRYRNTQSATGILYASTVLVWIGEAVALNLARSLEIPV